MEETGNWRVAQLLCSKLCHDLISPVGAINNGLELLGEDQSIWKDAVTLIGQSGKQAAARLSFFRIAFGGTNREEPVAADSVVGLAEDFFDGSKVTLNWSSPVSMAAAAIERPRAKLLLNLILLAAETLPRGGQIYASFEDVANSLSVASSGKGCRLTDNAAACLTGNLSAEELEVADVVPFLCRSLAKAEGLTIEFQAPSEDTIEFRAR